MTNIYIHPVTEARLMPLKADLPGALLLTGPEGIGLTAIATLLASAQTAQIHTVLPQKDERVDIEKGTITVDSIRKLYELTKTIEPKGRCIIIDYAERMGAIAQNAFLKLLEEPGEGTHFILLTHKPDSLLATILSRAQRLDVQPITRMQSEEILDAYKVHDSRLRSQLLFIAQGLPAELTRLATDTAYTEARSSIVRDAREYIIGTPYSRLLIAKKYKDHRPNSLILLEDAMKLIQKTVLNGGSAESLSSLDRLERAYERIARNGNIRLQLSAAML